MAPSSSSPGRAKQGKKMIFLPSFVTALNPSEKDADTTHFPRVEGTVERRQHSGRPSHVSLPYFAYKNRGRGRKKHREGMKKKREQKRKG